MQQGEPSIPKRGGVDITHACLNMGTNYVGAAMHQVQLSLLKGPNVNQGIALTVQILVAK
jgi:hypothetical protein